ncbi:hypothetical protein [Lentibacillus sp.]|uniref:hypothetical protein n=1 Tax=Lentibacillus sp. TaxID=1925746 RepID=UPI002B4B1A1E|nr:hypothetical protein [Lentibacillus sp.]HLS10329.1 hypothetical protein [Lentibacillus sp.]
MAVEKTNANEKEGKVMAFPSFCASAAGLGIQGLEKVEQFARGPVDFVRRSRDIARAWHEIARQLRISREDRLKSRNEP